MKSIDTKANDDYSKITAKNVASIMTNSVEYNLPELEDLCKLALSEGGIITYYYLLLI